MQSLQPGIHWAWVLVRLAADLVQFVGASLRWRTALAAENLFLRKQLALYRERQVKPRRASDSLRLTLVLLARCFAWREALTIVQPATLLRWHRNAFRLVWRWRSRPGRPRLPTELQQLIAAMARDNPTWGEERIAAELLLKLGLRVSPRTVRRYMGRASDGGGRPSQTSGQCWATFLRNHVQALVACDFCVAVTATFRILYVFVALEVGSRRLLHVNVTRQPTAAWTLQQFREILAVTHEYRFVPHGTASMRQGRRRPCPPWVSAPSGPRSNPLWRTPIVKGSWGRSAGNAWTSRSRSARTTCDASCVSGRAIIIAAVLTCLSARASQRQRPDSPPRRSPATIFRGTRRSSRDQFWVASTMNMCLRSSRRDRTRVFAEHRSGTFTRRGKLAARRLGSGPGTSTTTGGRLSGTWRCSRCPGRSP